MPRHVPRYGRPKSTDAARKTQAKRRGAGDHARPRRAADGPRGAGERLTVERLRHADGALPAQLLREMLIIRKFGRPESSTRGPDQAGTGAGAGDSSRIGARRSTAIRPPAPHLPRPFHFSLLSLAFFIFSFRFPRLTFFKRIFGLRPTHFDIYPLTGLYNGREGVETWLRRNTV